jgi:hypothetical protein
MALDHVISNNNGSAGVQALGASTTVYLGNRQSARLTKGFPFAWAANTVRALLLYLAFLTVGTGASGWETLSLPRQYSCGRLSSHPK